MRTLTEIDGFKLQRILTALQNWTQEGKPLEEIPQLLSTEFKVEGDPLKYLQHAVDLAKDRPAGSVKRILVGSLAEGEKAPPQAILREEQVYLIELFPTKAAPPKRGDDRDSGRRPGKGDRGKKGGGHRPDSRSDTKEARPPRSENSAPRPPAREPRANRPAAAIVDSGARPIPRIVPLTTPLARPTSATPAADVSTLQTSSPAIPSSPQE